MTNPEGVKDAMAYLTKRVADLEAIVEHQHHLLLDVKAYLVQIEEDYESDRESIERLDEVLKSLENIR